MLSEITKKGILAIKGLMDDCKNGIADANAALEVIDEKYRKIIAEEKKTLKANLSEYKMQLKQYEKMFSAFDSTAVKEVLGNFESTVTEEPEKVEETSVAAAEDTVVDNLFAENNELEETAEETPEEEKEPVFVEAEVKEETAEAVEEPAFEPKENIDWNTDENGEVKTMGESEWPEGPDNF